MSSTVYCQKEGCGRSWPRDPALEVACPECGAGVGVKCRRPSGHSTWQNHVHAGRDIAADRAGHYGICPSGRCGLDRPQAPAASDRSPQMDLFG